MTLGAVASVQSVAARNESEVAGRLIEHQRLTPLRPIGTFTIHPGPEAQRS